MRQTITRAAAGVLLLGVLAGCGGITQSHTLFATGPVSRVAVAPTDVTISVGGTQALAATAQDDRGTGVSSASFTWTAFNTDVATVDAKSGVVTAVAPGITSITATEASTGLTARTVVTVSAGPVVASFDRDIKPMATLGCSCHQPGGPAAAATGSMADLSNITAKGYVVPGNPTGSPYLVKGTGGAGHPGGNAWGANQQKVSDWIQQGAKP